MFSVKVSSPAIFPPIKISKILFSLLFFFSLNFKKFQFPPDFVEFKNPVPPRPPLLPPPFPHPFTNRGGAAMTLVVKLLNFDFESHWNVLLFFIKKMMSDLNVFWICSQNWQENTCARVCFLIMLQFYLKTYFLKNTSERTFLYHS